MSDLKYRALLKRNVDGVERWTDWSDATHLDSLVFFWTEGNFGCDCNRQLEFERAGSEPEDDDPTCGDDRYELISLELNDGRELYHA